MDRLSEAYTNTGSTTAVWEVLHHHCKGSLPLSQGSVFEGPPSPRECLLPSVHGVVKNIIHGDIQTERSIAPTPICPHISLWSCSLWVYLKNSKHLFEQRGCKRVLQASDASPNIRKREEPL